MKYYTKENDLVRTYYAENEDIRHIKADGTTINDTQIERVEYKLPMRIIGLVLLLTMFIGCVLGICSLK